MSAPLDGVHVLDLSWVMVGPASGRYLADMGADVIKVESSKRIDPVRTLGPFKDGKTGPERSLSYHNLNAGKRFVAIDIDSRGDGEVRQRKRRNRRAGHARRCGNSARCSRCPGSRSLTGCGDGNRENRGGASDRECDRGYTPGGGAGAEYVPSSGRQV